MEQYIKKSAIVAEIRKYIKSAEAFLKYHHNKKDRLCYSIEHQRLTMCELLSFLDTLEAKDVDFEALGILSEHLIACEAHGVAPKYRDREIDLLEKLKNNKAQKGK